MPKFRVVCIEEISTEFFVEAPNQERVDKWLEEDGADAVSYLCRRQDVHDRDYEVESWDGDEKTDYDTEKEVKP